MSRIDSGFFRQCKQMVTNTFFQFIKVSTFQVGTADAAIEEHIARKYTSRFLAIENEATRRMSRHMVCFQTDITECNDIAFAMYLPKAGCFSS